TGAGVYCVGSQCVDLNVCPTCTFTTVQAAIDAAPAGATIPIAAGSYDELITIDKNLKLARAGTGQITLMYTGAGYGTTKFAPIVTVSLNRTVTIEDVTITGGKNKDTNGPGTGGGILNNGTLTLKRCTITANEAGNGAGIYSDTDSSLTLEDTDVTSNSSVGNGAGIACLGALSITNGSVSNNSMTNLNNAGGGIYASGTMTATGVTIKGNSAGAGAGGIHLGTDQTLASTIWTMSACDVDGNSNTGIGGGIYVYFGALTISGGTTIRNNTAANGGGGLFISGGAAVTLNDTSSVTANKTTATNLGGGGGAFISFEPGTKLTLAGTAEISGNTATNDTGSAGGGGVLVNGSNVAGEGGLLRLRDQSKIRNNSATASFGGGVRSLGKVELSSGCLVTGNTASAGQNTGGGIYSGGFFSSGERLTGVTANNVTNNTPDNVYNEP
ncbi:MAG: hypothetical protein ACKOWF_01530, partial [Chloroflexota bacterium]